MHLKENIKLIKGFKLTDGNLYCRDYNFGAYSEIVDKTFKLDCKEEDLKMCEHGFHACDCVGKVDSFYPLNGQNRFFEIFVKKAFYEDAEKYVFTEFKVVGEINIPNYNTGDRNTGDYNTGDRNTGYGNTGDRNLTNYSAGFFAIEEPKASCFGNPTKFTVQQFREKFIDIIKAEPTVENLMLLPNATKSKVEEYIKKYEQLKNIKQ
ncbi:MAG: pentapeptide repeat-containing protein [Prevotellaceae bacterium]|jgi:hypothetical protein|nr:pentapeptide repeat-containing protein [Prevotellaceae bacterium]